MINHFNNALRHLLLAQIAELTDEAQVRFQPPDEDWRSYVSGLNVGGHPVNALNIYLADLRENRKLRSNQRERELQNGVVLETPAPRRMDCHYLITAWSPGQETPSLEVTLDQQALLYQVVAVLMNSEPLIPRQMYAPSPLPGTFPAIIADAELPSQILPAEGFAKLAEFWGTMGANHRWKPAVYLIVTLPVALQPEIAGPMVTTTITEYRHSGHPETAEVWIQIGGRVLDTTRLQPDGSPTPVADAWIRLENLLGASLQTARSNAAGEFIFTALTTGQYQLNWRATGFPAPAGPRHIDVPSPTGEYDLLFE